MREGFLPEMIKSVLERGMGAELTSHLGYELLSVTLDDDDGVALADDVED